MAAPEDLQWGSIVVLESGRVFGGDSVMAHLGTYEIDRNNVRARVRSWTWNLDVGDVENVFGMTGAIDYVALLDGERDGNTIFGRLSAEGFPEYSLACRMEKLADLP